MLQVVSFVSITKSLLRFHYVCERVSFRAARVQVEDGRHEGEAILDAGQEPPVRRGRLWQEFKAANGRFFSNIRLMSLAFVNDLLMLRKLSPLTTRTRVFCIFCVGLPLQCKKLRFLNKVPTAPNGTT